MSSAFALPVTPSALAHAAVPPLRLAGNAQDEADLSTND